MTFSRFYTKCLKRIFDILAGLIGCLLLIPLYLIVKIMHVIQKEPASVLFTQKRVGLNGELFVLYKFRTMIPDAEEQLNELLLNPNYSREWKESQKLLNDPRVTKTGKFLRRTSLDEWPQFINILIGDMSFVGPRPLLPGELELNGGSPIYNSIRPGLTGWWACNGRSDTNYEERLKLEYYYIKNVSLKLDLICLFKTFIAVATEKGAQ